MRRKKRSLKETVVNTKTSYAFLKDLKVCNIYEVSVRASTSKGPGPYSKAISIEHGWFILLVYVPQDCSKTRLLTFGKVKGLLEGAIEKSFLIIFSQGDLFSTHVGKETLEKNI